MSTIGRQMLREISQLARVNTTQDPNPDLRSSKPEDVVIRIFRFWPRRDSPVILMVHYSQGDSPAFEEEARYASSFVHLHCPPQVLLLL